MMVLPSPIESATAGRALPGEGESGDVSAVEFFVGGVLLALIDGLGHGRPAAEVAHQAADLIRKQAGAALDLVIQRCHAELRGSRGVVLSLAQIDFEASMLRWTGIGNVDGLLLQPRGAEVQKQALLLRGGVVGSQIPTPRVSSHALLPGDVLIFNSDGIRQGFTQTLSLSATAQQLADGILATHARPNDDALVLVVRWRGVAP
jgi:phosphoserine phosphatase RsbX